MLNASTSSSTLGAASSWAQLPSAIFPPPPPATRWVQLAASNPKLGLVHFANPQTILTTPQGVYARSVVPLPNGSAYLLVRVWPVAGHFREHFDLYYQAVGFRQVSALGAPAEGTWDRWQGDLPTQVAAAYERGRQPGIEWRGQIGSGHWVVRPNPQGGASHTLGSPGARRRQGVEAWRFVPRTRELVARPYPGDAASPWPPFAAGWAHTAPADDEASRELGAFLLGSLPLYHYHDALLPTGLYRFFAYETKAGQRSLSALRFWGTLGAPSTLGDAAGDLAQFQADIAQGDAALNLQQWGDAVTAYQTAGNLGATTLGPEIDTQTGGASQPVTQQAWGINTGLAAITSDASASQNDAVNAQSLVQQMNGLYQQAIAMPAAGTPPPATPTTPGTTSPQASNSTNVQAAIAAAQGLLSYLSSNPCTQSPIAQCFAFQTAYNASGLGPPITPDGKYGGSTQAALQLVLDASGGGVGLGGQAPPNCFTAGPAVVPTVNPPTPATPSGPSPAPAPAKPAATQASAASSSGSVVAAVALSALVVGGTVWAAVTGHLPNFLKKPS